jgi:hypothetical protein
MDRDRVALDLAVESDVAELSIGDVVVVERDRFATGFARPIGST